MKRKWSPACIYEVLIPAAVVLSLLLINGCSREKEPLTRSISQNTHPTASLLVAPANGTVETTFALNASDCQDAEDPAAALQVRWDFESDGVWDSEYSFLKTIKHQFVTIGTKTILVQVVDSGGLTDEATAQVSVNPDVGSVVDMDGNIYQTVKIGNQRWMAENLKVAHYCNGAAILHITDSTMWASTGAGAFCSFANNENWTSEYGRLYNLFAVLDSRRLAPPGWHIPSDAEWQELVSFLGGAASAGGKMMEAGYRHWAIPNTVATNSSGFTAVPGGGREGRLGGFYGYTIRAFFWSTTAATSSSYWSWALENERSTITRNDFSPRYGFSVRCVMD